MQSTAEICR